jgi:hypothetical protein
LLDATLHARSNEDREPQMTNSSDEETLVGFVIQGASARKAIEFFPGCCRSPPDENL